MLEFVFEPLGEVAFLSLLASFALSLSSSLSFSHSVLKKRKKYDLLSNLFVWKTHHFSSNVYLMLLPIFFLAIWIIFICRISKTNFWRCFRVVLIAVMMINDCLNLSFFTFHTFFVIFCNEMGKNWTKKGKLLNLIINVARKTITITIKIKRKNISNGIKFSWEKIIKMEKLICGLDKRRKNWRKWIFRLSFLWRFYRIKTLADFFYFLNFIVLKSVARIIFFVRVVQQLWSWIDCCPIYTFKRTLLLCGHNWCTVLIS